MLRLIAAFIALACCAAEGYRRSARLKIRVESLGEIERMLNDFAIEIRCSALTVDELMRRADGHFAELFARCRENSENAKSAWEAACGLLPQKDKETALLRELGCSLGTSDRAGQLQLLELYSERISDLRAAAESDCLRKAQAVQRVGILCGIAVAVLII